MALAMRRTAPERTLLNDLDRGEAGVVAAVALAVEDKPIQRIAKPQLYERRKQHVDLCTSRSPGRWSRKPSPERLRGI